MPYGLKASIVKQINNVFTRYDTVQEVILYGSRAKGNYKPGSDIDLTLKGKGLDLRTLNRIDSDLDDLLLPYIIDLSIYSRIDNVDLIAHIERVGVVFYERGAERHARQLANSLTR